MNSNWKRQVLIKNPLEKVGEKPEGVQLKENDTYTTFYNDLW